MAFIYVITNQINGKQYVGKTTHDFIEKRWKEHIYNSKRKRCEKRPLYSAINKYGAENFTIEQLEECSIEKSSDREVYWIDKLDTYHNGYNATYGGDGSVLYDYKEIADKYLELQSQTETARFFQCDLRTVQSACKECGISFKPLKEVIKDKFGKKIFCQELNLEFKSWHEAAQYLFNNNYTINKSLTSIGKNITRSCRDNSGKSTAYKMHWQYL